MLSVVIPIYNSSFLIEESYEKLSRELGKAKIEYEILFRNDGSKDNSMEVLKELAAKDNRVRVFSNPGNRGLGFTLRKLFQDARGCAIVYLDVDLSFGTAKIPPFLREVESGKIDIILASKYGKGSRDLPFYRLLPSRVYYLINKLLFGIKVKDTGAGFVLFNRKVLDKVKLKAEKFDIHIEFFAKAQKEGFRIKEIPTSYVHDENVGSFKLLKHGPRTLMDTFGVWMGMRKE